tara:strand:+ start:226 stop:1092 length:867 start_codon:yes stop_codon:yes gene_type:complete
MATNLTLGPTTSAAATVVAPISTAAAKELMERSMTTGVPTSEFAKYGGYQAVKAAYQQGGGAIDTAGISAADKTKYANQIATSGVGDLQLLKETNTPLTEAGRAAMTANGVTFDAAGLTSAGIPFKKTTDERLSDLTSQLATLQNAYNNLVTTKTTGGNTTTGGGTVNTGGNTTTGGDTTTGTTNSNFSNAGTTGVVYGPDGKMYSSAAAAIAAGVTNYTRTKPVGAIAGADVLGTGIGGTTSRGFMGNDSQVGNVNPGGLIAGQSKQLFNLNPNVKLPSGVANPFVV